MANVAPGTYYIISRVLSPEGEKLALTFNGLGNVTVTPFTNNSKQAWVVKDYNAQNQMFSPASQSNYQIGMGEGKVLAVYPSGGYTWTAKTSATGVLIADAGGVTNFWGLSNAVVDQNVPFGEGNGSDKQRWILIPA
ncbi:hypothetical protein PLEOSDRAFT_1065820 [Pleurotus ostreatus PC15]|uniref:CCL2-like lectin domain-containing protein n=1 Tax=Pleurotus ostreatus (strain PC15) TaxID=1137138 RepID=A0A067NS48_PLEO1|nr:hypothetical protein PLEOSDRAFT_1065820 [Pleurotus ostreatus PC15]